MGVTLGELVTEAEVLGVRVTLCASEADSADEEDGVTVEKDGVTVEDSVTVGDAVNVVEELVASTKLSMKQKKTAVMILQTKFHHVFSYILIA